MGAKLFLVFFLLIDVSKAEIDRISSIYKDLGKVEKIYLHAGLISVVEFPNPITEVRLGNTRSLKAEISSVSPKELTLFLSAQNVAPTNLIVRSNHRIYVFDVVPSNSSHQDYVKISGGYGSPRNREMRVLQSRNVGGASTHRSGKSNGGTIIMKGSIK